MPQGLAIATVDVSFPLLAPYGSAAAPSYSFAAATGHGMYADANRVFLAAGGSAGLYTYGSVLSVVAGPLAFSTNEDVILVRDAANVLAQRNGTNAQASRIYNTYTDASNYERGGFAWVSNALEVFTQNAGSGSARALVMKTKSAVGLYFGTNDTLRWLVDSSGHFLAAADNTYDIGDATHRVRTLWSPLLQGGSNSAHMRLDLGGTSALAATFEYNAAAVLTTDNTGQLRVISTGTIGFALSDSRQTTDAGWGRLGAASIRQGLAPSATPVAQTFTIGEFSRGGTDNNVAGADGTIRSGSGTGNAAGSSLFFDTPTVGASGSVQQSYGHRLTLSALGATFDIPDQGLRINNQVNGAGASAGTLTNAPSAGNPNFWLPISIAGVTRYFPGW